MIFLPCFNIDNNGTFCQARIFYDQYRNQNKKPRFPAVYLGGDTGTRTLDPMIKSHLLYQLSYVPKTEPETVLFLWFGGNFDIIFYEMQAKITLFAFLYFYRPSDTSSGISFSKPADIVALASCHSITCNIIFLTCLATITLSR